MRLNFNVGGRHLTLAQAAPAPGIGIAEAVALVAARGPGALPPGIADAVLRLAFGRGAGLFSANDASGDGPTFVSPALQGVPDGSRRLRLVPTGRAPSAG